jgi:flagellar hook-basal body complex protein FliE
MAITSIGSTGSFPQAIPAPKPQGPGGAGAPFADALTRLVGSVESTGAQANDAVARMLDGTGDVHEAMIALQQADTTFQLAVQVRNKFVQAYQEIMRMPI